MAKNLFFIPTLQNRVAFEAADGESVEDSAPKGREEKEPRAFSPVGSIILCFIVSIIYSYTQPSSALTSNAEPIGSLESIEETDRILIFAPHPDDESIGCAGIIQQARSVGADIHVVYLTNGEHNQFAFIVYKKDLILRKNEFIYMGEVRKKEAIEAMKLLGLNENNLIFLGYPDFGTFAIFRNYWQSKKPFKDLLTRISNVPYKENLSFGAPYSAESILSDFKTVLKKYRPNKIFVSHPADTNPDHKACYLFLEIAISDLEEELPRPKIYPYLIHCAGWPLPRHYRPTLTLLPPKQFLHSSIKWLEYELTPEQLNKKHRAILCYRSQTASSAFYLLAFARRNELFGDYSETELVIPVAEPGIDTNSLLSLRDKLLSFFGLSALPQERSDDIPSDAQKTAENKNPVSFGLEDESLRISIAKSKETARQRITTTVYLFGYSYKRPFAQMPKIRIISKYNNFKVFDGKKIIPCEGVSLELFQKDLILKIPFKLLGEPDFILASIKAYTGALPVYTSGFHKISIRRQ